MGGRRGWQRSWWYVLLGVGGVARVCFVRAWRASATRAALGTMRSARCGSIWSLWALSSMWCSPPCGDERRRTRQGGSRRLRSGAVAPVTAVGMDSSQPNEGELRRGRALRRASRVAEGPSVLCGRAWVEASHSTSRGWDATVWHLANGLERAGPPANLRLAHGAALLLALVSLAISRAAAQRITSLVGRGAYWWWPWIWSCNGAWLHVPVVVAWVLWLSCVA